MNILSKYSQKHYQNVIWIVFLLFCSIPIKLVIAKDTECAEVKIVIEQKLSFERQAFDARMVINNGLTDSSLKNIRIELLFTDKNNKPVVVTQSANDDGAKFFYRVNSLSGINSIDGNGEVNTKANAEIHWLIIPAYGAAELDDTLYYIGAKVTYTLNNQETTVEVTPDYVVVKPQPLLTLDYFMPKDVYGDDPFTSEVEPSIPFTLGVRIKNEGQGISYKTTIDSAQPKIVENKQNLLIDFSILNAYLGDQSVGKTLLLDFGDIEGNTSKVGRWEMIASLSGQFVEFNATFTHADTLGGRVTSLLKAVNTHTLIHDVKVDLPDRDNIADFLALDGDVIRVYESDGFNTDVIDQSLNAKLGTIGKETTLTFPETKGLVYVKVTDPDSGKKELTNVKRSDGKVLPTENVWLSKTRNDDLSWSYFINLFDSNSTGQYNLYINNYSQGDATISGVVYNDLDGNGLLNNEPGIGSVEVTLSGEDKLGNNIHQTTHTNQAGMFLFTRLPAGDYTIEVANVKDMIDGPAYPGMAGGKPGVGKITHIVLTNDTVSENNIFAKQNINQSSSINSADISADIKVESQGLLLGRHAQLLVTIKNNGPDKAENIYLEPLLPSNIEITSKILVSGKYNTKENRIDELKKNASTKIRLKVRVISYDGKGNFIARVSSQTKDPNLANNYIIVPLSVKPTVDINEVDD